MNSDPSFILMKPNTLKIIELIREIREEEEMPWYFTLDAGPNVHLMYPLEAAFTAANCLPGNNPDSWSGKKIPAWIMRLSSD